MNKQDKKRAYERTPNMPRSRMMLGIPFVGKDVPSEASEFAHPDIIIGLTIVAYRYEGVRASDFKEIIGTMRDLALKEQGPWKDRKTSIRYEAWVKAAGGIIRGAKDYRSLFEGDTSSNIHSTAAVTASQTPPPTGLTPATPAVVSLQMLKQSSRAQVYELYQLLRTLPDMIHWYLCEIIFPTYMKFQNSKISSCGQPH